MAAMARGQGIEVALGIEHSEDRPVRWRKRRRAHVPFAEQASIISTAMISMCPERAPHLT